jgi:CheY-like chemotaxis protein
MILFVDDEARDMSSYVDDLNLSGFEVSFQTSIDPALRVFQDNSDQIELLILDIMLPHGEAFDSVETEQGMRTGIRFYEEVRRIAPDLPVIVFTNVSDPLVADRLKKEEGCRFLRKEDIFPYELTHEVQMVLRKPKESQKGG